MKIMNRSRQNVTTDGRSDQVPAASQRRSSVRRGGPRRYSADVAGAARCFFWPS